VKALRRWWGVAPVVAILGLVALRACLATSPLDNLAPAASAAGDPAGSTARAGSLAVTRGGPLLLGFQSTLPARLTLDGAPLHDCHGITYGQLCRMIVMQGTHALRVAAGPDVRLVWSPVGRRGDPEYLPASSLSPDPPDRARFACPGTAKLDGIIALAIALVIAASLVALARRRLRELPREMWIAMAAVFVVATVVRWIDLGGAGQTWDEDTNWAAGRDYITNLLSLDLRDASWGWNFEHPPVMKYLAGIGAQLSDDFGPARALSAIWVALGCVFVVAIGARLYGFRTGVLAGLIAALLPPLIAHGQIVGHESPTVLWWSLGICLALGVHDGDPDRRRFAWRIASIGVVVGIATASRFVGGLLGPACIAIVVATAPPGQRRRAISWGLTLAPAVALVTFYAVWPRLWLHPFAAIGQSLDRLDNQHALEPFLGSATNTPGPHYFLVYLVATLPAGVLAGVLAWLVRIVRDPDSRRAALVLGLWFVIGLAVSLSPVRQDGVRYVMPCVVALCVMAAAGLDAVGRWIAPRWQHGSTAVATLVVGYLAIVDVRAHPYYLDYFGEQVGGAGTVQTHGWFETAWWGEGVDRAVAYVNANATSGEHVYRRCIEPYHLAWFREDLWGPMTENPKAADWIIAYSTMRCSVPPDFHRVFTVEHDGALFATVYSRRAAILDR